MSESYSATKSWVQWTGKTVGKSAWVLTTTALLVGLPLALSIEGEGALVAQEKEYMGQQVSFFWWFAGGFYLCWLGAIRS